MADPKITTMLAACTASIPAAMKQFGLLKTHFIRLSIALLSMKVDSPSLQMPSLYTTERNRVRDAIRKAATIVSVGAEDAQAALDAHSDASAIVTLFDNVLRYQVEKRE
jgi:hypothetical protein